MRHVITNAEFVREEMIEAGGKAILCVFFRIPHSGISHYDTDDEGRVVVRASDGAIFEGWIRQNYKADPWNHLVWLEESPKTVSAETADGCVMRGPKP